MCANSCKPAIHLFQVDLDKPWNYLWYRSEKASPPSFPPFWKVRGGNAPVMAAFSGVLVCRYFEYLALHLYARRKFRLVWNKNDKFYAKVVLTCLSTKVSHFIRLDLLILHVCVSTFGFSRRKLQTTRWMIGRQFYSTHQQWLEHVNSDNAGISQFPLIKRISATGAFVQIYASEVSIQDAQFILRARLL